jgi:hypothetical protein
MNDFIGTTQDQPQPFNSPPDEFQLQNMLKRKFVGEEPMFPANVDDVAPVRDEVDTVSKRPKTASGMGEGFSELLDCTYGESTAAAGACSFA